MHFFFKKNISKFLLFITLLLFITSEVNGQFLIQYPSPASNMLACDDNNLLTIRVNVAISTSDSNQILINLPPGITYKVGSVTKIGGTPSLQITENGGTPNTPRFLISPNTLIAGNFIDFTIVKESNCLARFHQLNGGIFKDTVVVWGSSGLVVENNPSTNAYNFTSPSLSFNQPLAISNAVLGTAYSRNFSISNGSNGCSDAVHFYIVYPSSGLTFNSLSLAGFGNIIPSSINGDTTFFTITGVGQLTADGFLCNGESLVLTENFTVRSCNASTQYRVGWGCESTPSAWCQILSGNGFISMGTGVGNLNNFTTTLASNFIDACGSGNGGFIDLISTWEWIGTGNSTAASAFNVKLRIGGATQTTVLQALDFAPYSFLGNASINGNIVPITNASGIFTLNLENLFSFDPDGVGGLSDIDGDGFFDDIFPGSTVVLNYQIQLNCALNCNASLSTPTFIAGDLRYNSMCNSSFINTSRVNTSIGFYRAQMNLNGYIPANIDNNQAFRVRMSAGWQIYSSSFRTSSTKFVWQMILPPGVTVSSTPNATWNNGSYYNNSTSTATTYSISGDTLRVISPTNNPGWAEINLIYDCAAGGNATTLNFNYRLIEINNSLTNCLCMSNILCGSLTTSTSCPVPCPAGPINSIPIVTRANGSIGWTNATLTTKQSLSNISAYDLSKALYLDTILIKGHAIQSSASSNLFVYLDLNKNTSNQNKLLPISVFYEVYRSGVIQTSGISTLYSMSASSSTLQVIEWDINAAIPLGGLLPNDSIYSESKYFVNTPDLPLSDVQSGGKWYFYNFDALASPQRVRCNDFVPEMYLVGTSLLNGQNAFNASSCNNANLGGSSHNLARRFSSAGITFQNEFRPGFSIDSFQILLPNGYDLVSVTYNAAPGFGFSGQSLPLSPTSIIGNTYKFVNSGSWLPMGITVSNNYGGNVSIVVKPTCATINAENITTNFYIKDYLYAGAGISPYPSAYYNQTTFNKNNSIAYSNKGNLVLSNQTGTIQAAAPTESWTVRLSNIGLGQTPFTWIAIPTQIAANVTQVVDVNTNAVLTPIAYAGGVWYQLSTAGLSSGTSRDYRIDFNYTSCTLDSLQVLAGWNCSGYPSSPENYLCNAQVLYLKFDPVNSAIELIPTISPTPPNNLCEALNYEYTINSSIEGNVANVAFVIEAQNGLFPILSSVQGEYPKGSGNWQTLSSTNVGNNYIFQLNSHPNYPNSTGLLGTINANTNEERQFGIRFSMETNCNFIANTNFRVRVIANSPCGSNAQGSNVPTQTPNILINGATASYTTVNLIVSDTLSNCSNNISIDVQTIIVAGNTDTTGTIQIDLPDEVFYVNNSINCTTAYCPILLSIDTINGSFERLTFEIPSGMVSGDEMNYSFLIDDEIGASCGEKTILLETFDKVLSIPCVTAPGGICSELIYSTGFIQENIVIEKPNLEIVLLDGDVSYPSPNNYDITISVANNSSLSQEALSNTIIDIFCSDSLGNPIGTPIYQYELENLIAANQVVNEQFNFTYNACNPLFGIVATINSYQNCSCDTFSNNYPLNIYVVENIDTPSCNSIFLLGQTFFTDTTIADTLLNASVLGFDSVIIYNVVINESIFTFDTLNACDSAFVNGAWYFASQNISTTNPSVATCDSTHNIQLIIHPSIQTNENLSACDSIEILGTWYFASQNIVIADTTSLGCDSTHTINVTIHPSIQTNSVLSACDSVQISGTWYFASQNIVFNDTTIFGCDSIHTIALTLSNSIFTFDTLTTCDSAFVNGAWYFVSQNISTTNASVATCDSVHTINLTINPSVQTSENLSACDSIQILGTWYFASQNVVISDTTSLGCDSTHTINLTIHPSIQTNSVLNACDSVEINGTWYFASQNIVFNDTTIFGCDSIHSIALTLSNSIFTFDTLTACDSAFVNGAWYFASQNIATTNASVASCDSTHNIQLIIHSSVQTNENISACDSIEILGTWYFASQNVVIADTTSLGCDSTHTINVTIHPSIQTNSVLSACDSVQISGTWYFASQNIVLNDTTNFGCDSIHTIALTLSNAIFTFDTLTACDSAFVNGAWYFASQNISTTNPSAATCDSTHNIQLIIHSSVQTNENISACDSIEILGTWYFASQNVVIADTTSLGCDSTHTINVTIHPSIQTNSVLSACDSVQISGTWYFASQNIVLNDTTNFGCDSIHTIALTLSNAIFTFDTLTACDSAFVNGAWYFASQNISTTNPSAATCDSTHNIQLIIHSSVQTNENISACDSIEILGTWYFASQNVVIADTTSLGCDSTHTINLSIHPSIQTNSVLSACDSVEISGTWYFASQNIVLNDTSIFGCDSIHTIALTLSNSIFTFDTLTACDSAFVNGAWYFASQNISTTNSSAATCDSTHNIQLIIHPSIQTNENLSACDSIEILGTWYFASQNVVIADTTSLGCDSTHTINVTIHPSIQTNSVLSACDSVQISGTWYFASQNIVLNDTTIFGCDSIHTIALTLSNSIFTFDTLTACDSAFVNGAWYFASQNISTTNPSATTCDSTHNIQLIIHPSVQTTENLSACDSIEILGTWYFASQNVVISDTTSLGCDSTHTINVTIQPSIQTNSVLSACDSVQISGTWYFASQNIVLTDTTIFGCDSTHTIALTLSNSIFTFDTITACDSAFVNGAWYFASQEILTNHTTVALCDSVHSIQLIIENALLPLFDPVDSICAGAALNPLALTSNNGIDGTWSPALNNLISTTYTFTPNPGICALTTNLEIVVVQNELPLFDSIEAICAGDFLNPFPLTSNNGIVGTWSPTIDNTITTNYTFTPSLGQCALTQNLTIIVNPIVNPIFNEFDSICQASFFELPLVSINNITGSWQPAFNSMTSTNYTFTPNLGECAIGTQIFINIIPLDSNFVTQYSCKEIEVGFVYETLTNPNSCDEILVIETILRENTYQLLEDTIQLNSNEEIEITLVNEDENLLLTWSNSLGEFCFEECNFPSVEEGLYQVAYYVSLLDTLTSCEVFDTLFVYFNYNSSIQIPNVFTPNGDGQNDIFRAYGEDIVQFQLEVFDRWGGRVYSTTNLNEGWDGLFNNQPLESGIYIVVIQAAGIDGQRYEIKQNIKLLR